MCPSLTVPGYGSNDEYPNFPAIGLGALGRLERNETPDPVRSRARRSVMKPGFQRVLTQWNPGFSTSGGRGARTAAGGGRDGGDGGGRAAGRPGGGGRL